MLETIQGIALTDDSQGSTKSVGLKGDGLGRNRGSKDIGDDGLGLEVSSDKESNAQNPQPTTIEHKSIEKDPEKLAQVDLGQTFLDSKVTSLPALYPSAAEGVQEQEVVPSMESDSGSCRESSDSSGTTREEVRWTSLMKWLIFSLF